MVQSIPRLASIEGQMGQVRSVECEPLSHLLVASWWRFSPYPGWPASRGRWGRWVRSVNLEIARLVHDYECGSRMESRTVTLTLDLPLTQLLPLLHSLGQLSRTQPMQRRWPGSCYWSTRVLAEEEGRGGAPSLRLPPGVHGSREAAAAAAWMRQSEGGEDAGGGGLEGSTAPPATWSAWLKGGGSSSSVDAAK